ncbi:hypothetical protein KUTeg_013724 [Tegillarca granosa]|uniref:Rhodanese domain-containing protein n=1 Tax=Tegillarca granosa TaxID=220873 RepID=A0ABQ9EZN1_TEGGR|nr:hypothetical protein KUTeg_013724 [Tegillarca granosa]
MVGIDINQPVVSSCRSGMTACGLAAALHVLGKDKTPVYYTDLRNIFKLTRLHKPPSALHVLGKDKTPVYYVSADRSKEYIFKLIRLHKLPSALHALGKDKTPVYYTMTDLKQLITNAKLDNIQRIVLNGKQKYLCFTHLTSCWVLCATDGMDVWRLELDEHEIEKAFLDGDLSVAMVGTKAIITIGKGAASFNFDLYEAKVVEQKTDLQSVLFRLAETNDNLETELTKANKTIENLKAQKGGGGPAFMDLGPKKDGHQARVKPNKTGMSVINPTSRKRKAATGVKATLYFFTGITKAVILDTYSLYNIVPLSGSTAADNISSNSSVGGGI